MKKNLKIVLLLLFILISCSCAKNATIMTINSNKSMNLEVEIGYSINSGKNIDINELKDNVSQLGFFVDSYHDNKYTGYKLTKNYKNINAISGKKNYAINLADVLTGNFEDSKLFTVKKGFFKNTYSANFTYDFRSLYNYKLKIYLFGEETDQNCKDLEEYINSKINNDNIEIVTYNVLSNVDNYNLLIDTLNQLNETYEGIPTVIIGNKVFNFNNNNINEEIINEIENILTNKKEYIDIINNDFNSDYEIKFEVNLPSKNISNNATEVTNDGKTLLWKGNYFNENKIEFTFSIFNRNSIVIIIISLLILVVLVIFLLIFYGKYKKDKNKFISKNTNIDNILPKIDDNNQIVSIHELIKK
jgi:hypothetical protein